MRHQTTLATGLAGLILLSAGCSGGPHADPHPAQAVRSALAGTGISLPTDDNQINADGDATCGALDRGEDAGSVIYRVDGSFVKGLAVTKAVVHAYCPKHDSDLSH
jgi:hypothetical protein